MTRVWRVCRRRYAAFDGEGARLAGGRWNRPGTPVIYAFASLSLAALEYFVHLDAADAPADLVAIAVDIPRTIGRRRIEIADLPANWRAYPAPDRLADLGGEWVRRGETPVLVVPSAVIPHEHNYLLNPVHRDFKAIRLGPAEPFSFDPRMWKG